MGSHNNESATSLVLGAVFIVLGVLELAAMWVQGDWPNYLSTNNLALGLILILTGAVFLAAVKGYRANTDGDAFLIVACMLGLFVGLVALLTLIADAAEAYLLVNEDFAEWSPMDDFTPALPMMVPCLVVLWYELKAFWTARPKTPAAEGKA